MLTLHNNMVKPYLKSASSCKSPLAGLTRGIRIAISSSLSQARSETPTCSTCYHSSSSSVLSSSSCSPPQAPPAPGWSRGSWRSRWDWPPHHWPQGPQGQSGCQVAATLSYSNNVLASMEEYFPAWNPPLGCWHDWCQQKWWTPSWAPRPGPCSPSAPSPRPGQRWQTHWAQSGWGGRPWIEISYLHYYFKKTNNCIVK